MARGQAVQIAKNMSDMVEIAIKEEMKLTSAIIGVQPHVIEAASKSSKEGADQALPPRLERSRRNSRRS